MYGLNPMLLHLIIGHYIIISDIQLVNMHQADRTKQVQNMDLIITNIL